MLSFFFFHPMHQCCPINSFCAGGACYLVPHYMYAMSQSYNSCPGTFEIEILKSTSNRWMTLGVDVEFVFVHVSLALPAVVVVGEDGDQLCLLLLKLFDLLHQILLARLQVIRLLSRDTKSSFVFISETIIQRIHIKRIHKSLLQIFL